MASVPHNDPFSPATADLDARPQGAREDRLDGPSDGLYGDSYDRSFDRSHDGDDDRPIDGSDIRQVADVVLDDRDGLPRRWVLPILSLAPLALFTASWLAGGVSALNGIGMVFLLLLIVAGLLDEAWNFTRRFGVGGICLHAGTLIWLVYDYLTRYLFDDPLLYGHTVSTVSKACLGVGIFYASASFGLRMTLGRRLERLAVRILPEPVSSNVLFAVAVAAFVFGISPYFLFTTVPFYEAMYLDFIRGYGDAGSHWAVGKTGGNINFNFGAYIYQMMDVGALGSLLGVFIVCMRRMGPFAAAAAAAMIGFWLLQKFGTGARGYVLYLALPIIGAFFLRQHVMAAWRGRRFSGFAYFGIGTALAALLVAITIQAAFRTRGFADISFDAAELQIEGNAMLSESLDGYAVIPDSTPPFYTRWPLEGLVRPVWDLGFWFVVGPIPRAIWTSKPIDEVWLWYNELLMRDVMSGDALAGTNITQSFPGHFFFRYGWIGVVQGGFLFGLLAAISERILRTSRGRILPMLLALGLVTWLFRSFRSPDFQNIYPVFIGLAAISLLCLPFPKVPVDRD